MGKLFEELKRRNVFRVAAVYAVAAWLLIQIAETVFPTLLLPDWSVTLITVLLILGFLPTLIAAWAFDLRPEGFVEDQGEATPTSATSSVDRNLIYAIFGLVLLVAGIQIAGVIGTGPAPLPPGTSTVLRADLIVEEPLTRRITSVRTQLGISPDGTYLVYGDVPQGSSGLKLMLRNLATGETRLLTDSAALGTIPEFSPDGQWVISSGGNRRIVITSILGGQQRELTRADDVYGGAGSIAWLSDDDIVYATSTTVRRKSMSTDTEEVIIESEDGRYPRKPRALPDNRGILYANWQADSSSGYNNSIIELYNLNSGLSSELIAGGYQPRYVPSGHIVFLRNGDLWAVPFDLEALEVSGDEVRVVEGVDSAYETGIGSYAVSDNGRLVYLAGPEIGRQQRTLVWVDRAGDIEPIELPEGIYRYPTLSPDGLQLAYTEVEPTGERDVSVYDFSRRPPVRRTFTEDSQWSFWTADGTQFVHVSGVGFWITSVDGSGQREMILENLTGRPTSFFGNGRALIYEDLVNDRRDLYSTKFNDGIWVTEPLLELPFDIRAGSISPDGRWLSYTSNRSGREEIYVRPYPDTDSSGPWQISREGGVEPRWNPNGDELFFLAFDSGNLMSAKLNTDTGVVVAETPEFLGSRFWRDVNGPSYDVSPDGDRFIGTPLFENEEQTYLNQEPAVFTVVENWFDELQRLAPASE